MTKKYEGHKPTKHQKQERMDELREIHDFCEANGIKHSATMDSFYFRLYGQYYRVSNHSIEASNSHAYAWDGTPLRQEYHPEGRSKDTIYIHAGKARIYQIYNDLKAGKVLNGHGYPIDGERPKQSKKGNRTPILRSSSGEEWRPTMPTQTKVERPPQPKKKRYTLTSQSGEKWDPVSAYQSVNAHNRHR